MSIIENEVTFSFSENRLPKVLDWIWPVQGVLEFDGMHFIRNAEDVEVSIHIFSSKTAGNFKERLKICRGKTRIFGMWETKSWSHGQKIETEVKHDLTGADLLCAIQAFGPVIAAIMKNRVRLEYMFVKETLVVGIDRMVPFDLQETASHGTDFFHIEFEAQNQELLDRVVGSTQFNRQSHGVLSPLKNEFDTKWAKARPFCKADTILHFNDERGLERYFENALRTLMPPKHALLIPKK